ncbi:hypothetical protein LZ30DRAFT_243616 [Colletotrichum cereale]|nr:hypothetical protein LZ30DRAFT_243616 [Colletotrichum cereale]
MPILRAPARILHRQPKLSFIHTMERVVLTRTSRIQHVLVIFLSFSGLRSPAAGIPSAAHPLLPIEMDASRMGVPCQHPPTLMATANHRCTMTNLSELFLCVITRMIWGSLYASWTTCAPPRPRFDGQSFSSHKAGCSKSPCTPRWKMTRPTSLSVTRDYQCSLASPTLLWDGNGGTAAAPPAAIPITTSIPYPAM